MIVSLDYVRLTIYTASKAEFKTVLVCPTHLFAPYPLFFFFWGGGGVFFRFFNMFLSNLILTFFWTTISAKNLKGCFSKTVIKKKKLTSLHTGGKVWNDLQKEVVNFCSNRTSGNSRLVKSLETDKQR